VKRAIAMAELERAEARGDVVEIELPAFGEPLRPAGFVGADAE